MMQIEQLAGERHWTMERSRLDRLLASAPLTRVPMSDAPVGTRPSPPPPYTIVNGVAVIPVTGMLCKYPDIFQQIFGGTSTLVAANNFRLAQDDPAVAATFLYVDSPGGQAAGTAEFGDAIAAATKPTVAYISDLGASGAYWIASQADQVFANAAAWIGSIGCYAVAYDQSKAAEQAGVTVTIIKAGEHKGDFVPGTAITPDQVAEEQRQVDTIRDQFVAAIARGRGLSLEAAATLATGQVWVASDAQASGLIDGTAAIDEVIQRMVTTMQTNQQQDDATPDTSTAKVGTPAIAPATPPKVGLEDFTARLTEARSEGHTAGVAAERARFTELADMAGDNPAFVMEQFTAGATIATAAKAYAATLKTQAKQAKTLDPSNGVAPLNVPQTGSAPAAGDPEQAWDANVGGVQANFRNKKEFVAFTRYQARTAASSN